ncbi:MAG: DNA translocase FtsK 4TM domain-containing protein, partial [Pyrinomonadaceae bacterium]|nr:DNA translocase FtsK 4TM domain-containing protein [Pyrinomonadaceae bacterium]
MATTQTEVRVKPAAPKNTRRNEIIAIALFALGVLLALCLASYNPNDASWNAAGQAGARNLVGAVGSNIAATLFQFVGLAAYLLPLLLLAAAWRRFRTRHIHAPLSRVVGLLTLTLSASALLALSGVRPMFDASVQPGGLVGTLISRVLESGLNTVGASVLLIALAATGLLLATNFSFVRAYEWLAAEFGNRFTFLRTLPEKFSAWRADRRERARLRMEQRQTARAERAMVREVEQRLQEKTGADRVAEFMSEESPLAESASTAAAAIKRSAAQPVTQTSPTFAEEMSVATVSVSAQTPEAAGANVRTAAAGASISTSVTKRTGASSRNDEIELEEADEIEAMVKSASVVRTDLSAQEDKTSLVQPDRAKRDAIVRSKTEYKLPSDEFLTPAPPHSEQAEEALRLLATQVAEKCREFNVTGKIEYICPGPVVTTYEFKPDPGVKYSRVTGLVDDLCLALRAESIRIDRVPGKAHVGIEVPNPQRETIYLREVIESRQFRESQSKLTIALGKTIDGLNYVTDLAKMPHLLIAGATGAGKSVGVNSLIVSILYKASDKEVK